jgi:hydrogenase/urease accessory protein HupE
MSRSGTRAMAHARDNRHAGGCHALAGLLGASLLPTPAYAHLVNSGMGPFYDGALHLLLSPGELLGLLALTLLAGLAGARPSRVVVCVLPVTWLLAGTAGLQLSTSLQMPWLSVVWLVIPGALVAADLKLAEHVIIALAGLFAALQGLLNGVTLQTVGAGLPTLLGIVVTVFMITLLGSALVVAVRAAWFRTVVRVAGSWVAAVGILMFGWMLRGAG